MTTAPWAEALIGRFPQAAAALYVALVAALLATTAGTVLDLAAQREAVSAAADLLDQLGSRGAARPRAAPTDVAVPVGSPFLEGATASVAGAALLQRLGLAVTRVQGSILSSQVDLQGPQAKAGFVTATASLELNPAALQALLYDIEAGMPFLFVDQMAVQTPAGSANSATAKHRVLLSVSGQWQGGK